MPDLKLFLILSILTFCFLDTVVAQVGPVKDVESTAKVLPEFPKFEYKGVVLGYENLKFKPHNDICFVTVFKAYEHFDKPLGKYYMYYAAHDVPAEICLAYADKLEGAWTEYERNPVIRKEWPPHYKVSHVSSPDALWIPEEKKMFLYYHGENNVTRFATTSNGIDFEYGGEAVNLHSAGIDEASYARTARFEKPDGTSRYIMIYMGVEKETRKINPVGIRKCYLAVSEDGRKWKAEPKALLEPPPGTDQLTPGAYLRWSNRNFIIATGNLKETNWDPVSNFYLFELDEHLQNPKLQGVLFDRGVVAPENRRFSSPCFLEEDGKIYMFFAVGKRCNENVGLAIAYP